MVGVRPVRDTERIKLAPFWRRSPSHMLGKVAEALALRRGFPEVEAAVSYVDAAPIDVEADDAEILAEVEAEAEPRSSSSRRARYDDGPPPEFYDDLPEANR